MEEVWVDIRNFEGHYQVSNFGRMEGRHIDIAKIYNISRQSVCGIKNRRNWKNATKSI
jgi:hypothetical protein